MKFDPFVLPFLIGLNAMFVILIYKYQNWFFRMDKDDRKKILTGFFSRKIFFSIKEIFLEALIHRKIFRVNFLLGFMHMSLAFGWFLLIIFGTIESKLDNKQAFSAIYDPIFLKFFEHDLSQKPWAEFFSFFMDFLLLFVLIGLGMSITKRFIKILYGLKRTTHLKPEDKIALKALWLIFPLRLAAESFTAAIYSNGGFLTNNTGKLLAASLPIEALKALEYPTWWAYSSVLGIFFILLPFSRYMHIPTEVWLIIMRNSNVGPNKKYDGHAVFELNACSRCGICIDTCQLNISTELNRSVPAYFLHSIKYKDVEEKKAFNCMLCGRCKEYCPVGIDTINQRLLQRKSFVTGNGLNYSYLTPSAIAKADIAYFAGCMSHLTPGIIKATETIFKNANINYTFIDKDGSVCCGRPALMAGKDDAANKLIEHNKKLIKETGVKILVTNCPICYKGFKEEYDLNIQVMHHTQYINLLIGSHIIQLNQSDQTAVYHDPCELGRGSGIYDEPRNILTKIVSLQHSTYEKENALCCGGSLGQFNLTPEQKEKVRKDALKEYSKSNPEVIVTACPLCKKTFSKKSDIEIKDIAEVVAGSLKNATKTIQPIAEINYA